MLSETGLVTGSLPEESEEFEGSEEPNSPVSSSDLFPDLQMLSGGALAPGEGTTEEAGVTVSAVSAASSGSSVPAPFLTRERGVYTLNENDLSEEDKQLLHYRSFVIDREAVTEGGSGNPRTYYIAYDQVQGLVVPARNLSIDNHGPGSLHYRWTDDGEKWTSWITLEEGVNDEYVEYDNCRFAEVQVYADRSGGIISMRATR